MHKGGNRLVFAHALCNETGYGPSYLKQEWHQNKLPSVLGIGASKKRKQTFLKSYDSDYPWIRAAKENTKAFCKLCFVEINISHGGKHDIEVHAASAKHKSNKASAVKTNIAAAMKQQVKSDDDCKSSAQKL